LKSQGVCPNLFLLHQDFLLFCYFSPRRHAYDPVRFFIAAIPSGEWNTAAAVASRQASRLCHEIHQVNDTHTTAMLGVRRFASIL
jgi:hypothetical protein